MNLNRYDDIIHLPHPVSPSRPHMPQIDRAAQFAPFSALSGFAAAIEEAARQTEAKRELSEDAKDSLDEALRMIQARIDARPKAAITYFQPDPGKSGGAYITVTGRVKKIDAYGRAVVMQDGRTIPMGEIVGLESR